MISPISQKNRPAYDALVALTFGHENRAVFLTDSGFASRDRKGRRALTMSGLLCMLPTRLEWHSDEGDPSVRLDDFRPNNEVR